MKENFECMICLEDHFNNRLYFNCEKPHRICEICINKLIFQNKKTICPLCRADFVNEMKPPNTLTNEEILLLDIDTITHKYIYIHQNVNFYSKYDITSVVNCKEILDFYSKNGNLVMYMGMFISTNGFFYSYNEETNCYQLAVKKNKYQFWDLSRIFHF